MPSPFGTGVAVLLILLHGKEKAASVLVAALQQLGSANCSVAPASAYLDKNASSVGVEKLPEEMNDMKISDDKKMEAATLVDGNGTETGYIIVTTIGGKNGQPKQAKCLETGETVAIKKILQDKKYKNRELKTMRLLDHPNVVSLKHCFFLTAEKDDLYLNLVFEYVPETASWVIRHYNKMNQQKKLSTHLFKTAKE